LQKGFERATLEGWGDNAQKIQELAKENGIELEVKESDLQEGFERALTDKNVSGQERIKCARGTQELARKNGIKIEVKEDILQREFETALTDIRIEDVDERTDLAKAIQEFAQENGIKITFLKKSRGVFEDAYIRSVHDPDAGHVQHLRENLIDGARLKEDININYSEVVKMNYLELLNIPKKNRIEKEKKVKLGDVDFRSIFYGQIKEKKCEGKFILAKDPETKETSFIFDATLGEHRDIGNKYGMNVIGGGWLEIDNGNKKVIISSKSEDFGYEPRLISTAIIAENFSDYKIEVEK